MLISMQLPPGSQGKGQEHRNGSLEALSASLGWSASWDQVPSPCRRGCTQAHVPADQGFLPCPHRCPGNIATPQVMPAHLLCLEPSSLCVPPATWGRVLQRHENLPCGPTHPDPRNDDRMGDACPSVSWGSPLALCVPPHPAPVSLTHAV